MDNPFYDAEVRIERMMYIPAIIAHEEFPDDFETRFLEWFEDAGAEDLTEKFAEIRARLDHPDGISAQRLSDLLNRVPGFLVEAETPTRLYEGDSYYSGWGRTHYTWLHAPTEADIGAVCAAWAEKKHTADRLKGKPTPAGDA